MLQNWMSSLQFLSLPESNTSHSVDYTGIHLICVNEWFLTSILSFFSPQIDSFLVCQCIVFPIYFCLGLAQFCLNGGVWFHHVLNCSWRWCYSNTLLASVVLIPICDIVYCYCSKLLFDVKILYQELALHFHLYTSARGVDLLLCSVFCF
jgi:hypothetical protein